jgi:hypothetical protein
VEVEEVEVVESGKSSVLRLNGEEWNERDVPIILKVSCCE